MSDDAPRKHEKGERCTFARTAASATHLHARCKVCHATKAIALPPDRRADDALAALNRPPPARSAEDA